MAIDHFTRADFESSLPKHKVTGARLWESGGIVNGEHVYYVLVSEYVSIAVRSSVGPDGHSADTGEDSIRLLLVDRIAKTPKGPKLSRYVTRVPGWQDRMTAQLRTLWELGRKVRLCECGAIGSIFRVMKEGANHDRLFLACPNQKHLSGQPSGPSKLFEWLSEPKD